MKGYWAKRIVIAGLTATMILGGSTAAFADNGKAKGHDKHNDIRIFNQSKHDVKSNSKANANMKANLNIHLSFKDITGGDVEWAMRYIASLASKHVFEGYDDGTFQPRKPVTRVEAITAAVRLMGLRDQAESSAEMNTQLNFSDANKIKSQYPWAVGYVAVAAENDLFAENDDKVQPEKPADRLWATTLLVKALKLEDQAHAKANAQLTYKDAEKIPAGSIGYVALAIERGLINGYPDNTFRPNQPVTRAELAALLDRTGNQIGDENNQAATVSAAVYNNVLTITQDGQTKTVVLDPNAFIFRNGARVAASQLQVGDQIRIHTYNNVVYYVEVTGLASQTTNQFTVNGTFNSFTLNAQGKIATISINQVVNGGTQTAVYNVDSEHLTIYGNSTGLTLGHAIVLKGLNQLVNEITIP
jgi:hypothetical protein